jgi:hypothetical protein
MIRKGWKRIEKRKVTYGRRAIERWNKGNGNKG